MKILFKVFGRTAEDAKNRLEELRKGFDAAAKGDEANAFGLVHTAGKKNEILSKVDLHCPFHEELLVLIKEPADVVQKANSSPEGREEIARDAQILHFYPPLASAA